MFGRKKRFSTSRFVERAIELDTFQLFTSRCLTVAISKISTGSTLSHSDQRYASAIGVLHDERGDGQPLLPVKVEFDFYGRSEKVGWGSIEIYDKRGMATPFPYEATIFIPDRDGNFFSTVQKAAEHAAISGNSFLHLVFQRRKKKPYDAGTESQELKAEHERLETLMRRIDAGEKDAMMPPLEFDSIWIEDAIHMKAPAWSYTWPHDSIDRTMYHSRDTAKWRSMPWRQ